MAAMEEYENQYHRLAEMYLQRCDELLEECAIILDSVECILETTPKPSELLGWPY
jgi:hypothetical protein